MNNKFLVYFLYDSEDNLLYIGKTTALKQRLKQHFSKSCMEKEPWKSMVDLNKITVYECNNPTDLDLYEIYFINKYKPTYNKERVFHHAPTIDLPYLSPINVMDKSNRIVRIFNVVMTDYDREGFVCRVEDPVEDDFCWYNPDTNRLEIRI